MSGALKSIPGLIQTVIDRLTSTRAANLDNLDAAISTRAAAATALSTTVWTNSHADALAGAAQERGLAAGGLLGGSTATGDSGSLAQLSVFGLSVATTGSTLDVDVVNYTGPGVLSFLEAHIGSAAGGGFVTVTLDGVVAFSGATNVGNSAYNRKCIVGTHAYFNAANGTICFEDIPFRTSLRIQHRAAAGSQINTIYRYRKHA